MFVTLGRCETTNGDLPSSVQIAIDERPAVRDRRRAAIPGTEEGRQHFDGLAKSPQTCLRASSQGETLRHHRGCRNEEGRLSAKRPEPKRMAVTLATAVT